MRIIMLKLWLVEGYCPKDRYQCLMPVAYERQKYWKRIRNGMSYDNVWMLVKERQGKRYEGIAGCNKCQIYTFKSGDLQYLCLLQGKGDFCQGVKYPGIYNKPEPG